MSRLPPDWRRLRKNQRKIVEVLLKQPHCALSYPWFKNELCRRRGMSDRRLRSNLKKLVSQGILGEIPTDNGGVFYGFPNVTDNPSVKAFCKSSSTARGEPVFSLILPPNRVKHLTYEEMIEDLRMAKENPVFKPRERSERRNRALMKNYLTMIDWQIEWYKEQVAKREMEKRRKEIEQKYGKADPREPETRSLRWS